jgi:hypothetical protein
MASLGTVISTNMKKLLLLFVLFAFPTFGQGVRAGDNYPIVSGQIPGGPIFSVPNAVINFCASPNIGVPCVNKATTYTDITLGTSCPSSTQIVLAGTNNCVGTTDGYGNWGVWVAAGTYTFTVTLPGGGTLGPYTVTLAAGGGGSSSVSVNGSTVPNPNFNNTLPNAPPGFLNCNFAFSGSAVSLGCPFGNTSASFLAGNGNALTSTFATTAGSATSATTATTATTAAALSGTPTLCSGSTPVAKGILANGNASCVADVPTLTATPRVFPNGYTAGAPGTWGTFTAGQCPGGSGTGTSYTYLSTDFSCIVTRGASGAMTDTLPAAGTTGFGSNYYLSVVNDGTASDVITTTTSTFTCVSGPSSYCSGSTLTIPAGKLATIWSPDNANWNVVVTGGGAFPLTVTGGVSGGIPCFTSTTTEAASGLLGAGGILLGGGAGACPLTNTGFTLGTGGGGGFQLSIGLTGSGINPELTFLGGTSGIMNINVNSTATLMDLGGSSATVSNTGALTVASCVGCQSAGTPCQSSASPAVCGSSSQGSVVIAAGATTVVVDTTAVTAISQIFVYPDESLSASLGVTCNSTLTIADAPTVISARSTGTSFTIKTSGTITTNPACYNYQIIN